MRHAFFAVFNQHWACAQELENLKTGGGGEADLPAAAAGLADAASLQQSTGTEFSPQGRVVQLADLPASALPTTDSAPPVTAASASVKTISESAHSTQVWPHVVGNSFCVLCVGVAALCNHCSAAAATHQGHQSNVCIPSTAGPGRRATRRQPPGRGLRLAVADPGQPDAAAGRLAVGLRRQPGRRRGGALRVQRPRRLKDHQPRHAVSERH